MRGLWCWALALALLHAAAQGQKPDRFRQGVQWQVVPEQRVVEVGRPVVFILEVRNVSGAPMELRFSSGKQFDVLVYKQGEWGERWQWSRGKAFTMAFSSIRLNFGEVKRFRVEWEQKDNDGRQVPPGNYRVEAILSLVNHQGRREELKASAGFTIRAPRRYGSPRLRDLLDKPASWIGQRVVLEGRHVGWQPDPLCPACKEGPPVSRSDWVLQDETGCIYITKVPAPSHMRGQPVVIEGIARMTPRGQMHLEGVRVYQDN